MNHFATNNKYFDCPPMMSDGRNFTNYLSFRQYTKNLENQHSLQEGSYGMKEFLTHNAEQLMSMDRQFCVEKNGCGGGEWKNEVSYESPCANQKYLKTVLPEAISQTCNTRSCKFQSIDNHGLGLGRDTLQSGTFVTKKPEEKSSDSTKDKELHSQIHPNTLHSMFNYLGTNPLNNYNLRYTNSGAVALTGGDTRVTGMQ